MTVEPLYIAAIILSGAIGRYGAALVARHARQLQLVQAPNHRSSHVAPTPHGGGLGIVVAGLLVALLLSLSGATDVLWIALLGLALALVGLRDDIHHLSARTRLLVQLLVCALLLALLGTWHPTVASAALLVTLMVAGVWWINLFNFMDGIDGLAASQAIFMLVAGCLLSIALAPVGSDGTAVWFWMLAIAAASFGFLLLNWPPASIFMGDVGSTYLGFAIFAVAFISVQTGWLSWAAWLILGALFTTDASVTLLRRLLSGQGWTQAHRSHAYQRLARRWRSHGMVAALAAAVNLFWLLPLATLSLLWPAWASWLLSAAYLPLVIIVVVAGAGSAEHV